jgi:hypothetical protein
VFWLQRPPYARWAGTILLVAFAVAIDMRGEPTVVHPFAATDLQAGSRLDAADVEWRDVPGGLLPTPALDGMFTARFIADSEPIVPSAVTPTDPVPAGWWAIELQLPGGVDPGTRARVVIDDPPLATDAIVVSVTDGGAFGASTTGLVAIPARFADEVGRAARRHAAVVLVRRP